MGTHIKLDFGFIFPPVRSIGRNKEQPFPFTEAYCKEDPEEVLEAIGKQFHINRYKRVKAQESRSEMGTVTMMGNANTNEHRLSYTMNLAIPKITSAGLGIEATLKDINLNWLKDDTSEKDYEANVNKIINNYFITTHVPLEDSFWRGGIGGRRVHVPRGNRTVENYFKGKRDDEQKELQLADLVEYAQIMLDNPKFSERDVIKRTNQLYKDRVQSAKSSDTFDRRNI